jgi:hypothetical protein
LHCHFLLFSPFSQWLGCINGALSACSAIDHPMFVEAKGMIDLMATVIKYVCEEKLDGK